MPEKAAWLCVWRARCSARERRRSSDEMLLTKADQGVEENTFSLQPKKFCKELCSDLSYKDPPCPPLCIPFDFVVIRDY